MNIRTERCELTPVRESDAPQLSRLAVDPTVRAFLGGPVPMEEVEMRVRSLIEAEGNRWAIRLPPGTECVGLVDLSLHHDGVDTEVSYQFLPEACGQGYAFEAVGAVLDHAFAALQLPRLIAETQASNAGSRRLLERLGMSVERTLERYGAEQVIYALVAPHSKLK